MSIRQLGISTELIEGWFGNNMEFPTISKALPKDAKLVSVEMDQEKRFVNLRFYSAEWDKEQPYSIQARTGIDGDFSIVSFE